MSKKRCFSNSDVHQRLNVAYQRNKARYDKGSAGNVLHVGDRVWLYVHAVKQGRTKKLSSLWRGPYTILDRIGAVNYRIQLIGLPKCLWYIGTKWRSAVVSQWVRLPGNRPCPQRWDQTRTQLLHQDQLHQFQKPWYADIVMRGPATIPAAGYTSSSYADLDRESWPQQNYHPPNCYGTYVTH